LNPECRPRLLEIEVSKGIPSVPLCQVGSVL
jgi:hypothetical protein